MTKYDLTPYTSKALGSWATVFDKFSAQKLEMNSYSYSSRRRKVIKSFCNFVISTELDFDNSSQECINLFFEHHHNNRGDVRLSTRADDWRALRSHFSALITLKAFPKVILPGVHATNRLLKEAGENNLLGYVNPQLFRDESLDTPLPLLRQESDCDYLDNLCSHIRDYLHKILLIARKYIKEASSRYDQGQKFISEVDTSIFIDNPYNYSDLTAVKGGQQISLFSDLHSNGLKNLVAYYNYQFEGLIIDFPGSSNHLRQFGRTNVCEHLGLSTDLAAACAIVIVNETGINVESLYNFELDSNNSLEQVLMAITGGYKLNYNKPRAGGSRDKTFEESPEEINAAFCFNLLNKVTEKQRLNSGSRKLFIGDTVHRQGKISEFSATAFKSAFKRLIESSTDDMLINSNPNLAKVRVTKGVLEWYDNGGDSFKASRFLGNSSAVALKNYIPQELQDIFYAKKIRNFQEILIVMATKDEDREYRATLLGLKSIEQLNELLEKIFSMEGINLSLLGIQSPPSDSPSNKLLINFVLSETNIATIKLAIELHKEAKDNNREITKRQEELANIGLLALKKIQVSGTRRQRMIMKRGIDLFNNEPKFMELLGDFTFKK